MTPASGRVSSGQCQIGEKEKPSWPTWPLATSSLAPEKFCEIRVKAAEAQTDQTKGFWMPKGDEAKPTRSRALLGDLRRLIAEARQDVARQVNSALVLL